MQKLEKAGEPTMEEILASIRQIISEEPATRQPPPPIPQRGPGAAQPFSMPAVPSMAVPTTAVPAVKPPLASPPPQFQPAPGPAPLPPQAMPPASIGSGPTGQASEAAARAGHPGGDPVAMSDSLSGPPRSPATGVATANLTVAQNAEQYGKSMWRFGKRAAEPELNSSDLTLSIELPGVNAPVLVAAMPPVMVPPVAAPAQTAMPPASASPKAAPAQPQASAAPMPPAVGTTAVAAPPINLPAASRIAPSSDVLASFIPGSRPSSIVGVAQSATVSPAAAMQQASAPPFVAITPKPAQSQAPAPVMVPAATVRDVDVPPDVAPTPVSSVLPPVRPMPPVATAASPSPQSLDVNAAMSALAAGLAGGMRGADQPPRLSPAVARAELPSNDRTADRAPAATETPAPTFVPVATAPPPAVAASPVAQVVMTASAAQPAPAIAPPPPALAAMMSPVKSLEDVVVDLLRPMLRQWLDDNMPRIIEKSLRVELAESLKKAALPKQ